MARVILDTVNLQDRSFQRFLKENRINANPRLNDIEVVYTGERASLEDMIDTHFFDENLKDFIEETEPCQ